QTISAPRISEEEVCLKLLRELKMGIKSSGFDSNRDSAILSKLYGNSTGDNGDENLFCRYLTWSSSAKCSNEERPKNGSVSSLHCVKAFLTELQSEIKRLNGLMASKWTESKMLRRYVPEHTGSDRLQRYETSLERGIDRTLSQLERLQRIRRGQPV